MGIVSLTTDVAGQVGIKPRTVRLVSTDPLAVVQTAGYLNTYIREGFAIYPTDIFDVIYNYNAALNVGLYQQLNVTMSNGIPTLGGIINLGNVAGTVVAGDLAMFNASGQVADSGMGTATVVLNQAAVQGAFAAPVLLVAAPGAGKVIMVTEAIIYTNFQTTAFAGGGVGIVQYGNAVNGAGKNSLSGTIAAANITAAASQVIDFFGSTSALTAISNLGLYFSNQTAAFTGGTAASTVVITLNYNTVAATV